MPDLSIQIIIFIKSMFAFCFLWFKSVKSLSSLRCLDVSNSPHVLSWSHNMEIIWMMEQLSDIDKNTWKPAATWT